MPTLLVVTGGILVVLAFLLAFTIYGLIAAAMGVACVTTGAVLLGRARVDGSARRIGRRERGPARPRPWGRW